MQHPDLHTDRAQGACRQHLWPTLALALMALGASLCVDAARAMPTRPTNPDLVLLVVPARNDLASLQEARRAWQAAPTDAQRVEHLVDEELKAGRRYADPRYFGQAEALLVTWRAKPVRPLALDVQWADILQHRHDYVAARAVLNEVLSSHPDTLRARLMRAQMDLSEGRLAEARSDCGRLVAAGGPGLACLAQVLGLSGQLGPAYTLLSRAIAATPVGDTSRSWMLSALGEMALRRGEPRATEWLQDAVAADPGDQYARLALADALIDRGQLDEAAVIVRAGPRSDAALLRLSVIGARRNVADRTDALELAERYREAERRGEVVHLRDRARFELYVLGRADAALKSASENFNSQREPWDTRLLLEAAKAMRDRKAAAAAVAWRNESHYEDVTLTSLFAWAEASS